MAKYKVACGWCAYSDGSTYWGEPVYSVVDGVLECARRLSAAVMALRPSLRKKWIARNF